MTPGQLVDYVVEWNNIHDTSDEENEEPKKRRATQADWDAFFG